MPLSLFIRFNPETLIIKRLSFWEWLQLHNDCLISSSQYQWPVPEIVIWKSYKYKQVDRYDLLNCIYLLSSFKTSIHLKNKNVLRFILVFLLPFRHSSLSNLLFRYNCSTFCSFFVRHLFTGIPYMFHIYSIYVPYIFHIYINTEYIRNIYGLLRDNVLFILKVVMKRWRMDCDEI